MNIEDDICVISTPAGIGAIALVRVSGKNSISIVKKIFSYSENSISLEQQKSHTVHHGFITKGDEIIDDVLLSVFKNPNSYTGQDLIEISCHGSIYVQQEILKLLIDNGARLAKPGEFTMRAFLNGKFDLSQAEAVADLINSYSQSAHKVAIRQIRGGFSNDIKKLRDQLLEFSSLLELELDFSEENVEFANRSKFKNLLFDIKEEIKKLIDSFSVGNVIKNGIPVAIVGKPNVGKSTLLNALLNEEKAIVSEIPGTTRDAIEDTIVINGYSFRFIDTAGLRDARSKIEIMGIEKTYQKIEQASIILYVVDINETPLEEINTNIEDFKNHIKDKTKKIIVIANKTDLLIEAPKGFKNLVEMETIFASAKRKENIKLIAECLVNSVLNEDISNTTIITNVRHYEALSKALTSINNVEDGLKNKISSELLASDIRNALHYLGEITGEVTSDEILNNIFGKFCVGK
ncbi:MAG: tRNA uridine-5-carboxymethylaminomethyl(34) synthesis GTPase MnmE [Bacteroidales bacterium]|jgi:tRNA modification GTPase